MKEGRGYFIFSRALVDSPFWEEIFFILCDEFSNIKVLPFYAIPICDRPHNEEEHIVLEMGHPLIGDYGSYTIEITTGDDRKMYISDIEKAKLF